MRPISSTSPDGLSIAEAFTLLSLAFPTRDETLAGWSDVDFALAGAHLIDLSFQNRIDSDVETVFAIDMRGDDDGATPLALKVLQRFGGRCASDIVLNEVVGRIGELRAQTLSSLAARNILTIRSEPILWGFAQSRIVDRDFQDIDQIRAVLAALIETDDLPDPEQAALIALLNACGMIAAIFGGASPDEWIDRFGSRVESIGRIDLVGRRVADLVLAMRRRLRTYLHEASAASKAAARPARKKSAAKLQAATIAEGTTWEWRAFWPADDAVEIPLSFGLVKDKVDPSEESNLDIYLFVYGKRDNIKFRGKGLKVKPVVEAFDEFCAFAPSAKVSFPTKAAVLSTIFPRFHEVRAKLESREELLAALSATGYQPSVIEVTKARREYPGIFGVDVELARIWVGDRQFHSICLESRYLTALRVLARGIPIGNGIVGSYGDFLEQVALNRADNGAIG